VASRDNYDYIFVEMVEIYSLRLIKLYNFSFFVFTCKVSILSQKRILIIQVSIQSYNVHFEHVRIRFTYDRIDVTIILNDDSVDSCNFSNNFSSD